MTITEQSHCISRRPDWADNTTIGPDAIDYTWTAPTVVESIEPGDGELVPVSVDVTREDVFSVTDDGVLIDEGPERVFVLDTNLDLDNARKLAAAILECCDRIEGAR